MKIITSLPPHKCLKKLVGLGFASLITISALFPSSLEARTWTSSDGKSIEAEFVRYKDDFTIVIAMKGKEYTLPLTKFSQADRDWLTQKKEEEVKALAEKKEKVKDLVGRMNSKPIHTRLFAEPDDYFKEPTRKKVLQSLASSEKDGPSNAGTYEEWMERDLEKDTCTIYVPSSYDGSEPYGLFLYIHYGGKGFMNKAWQPIFDEYKIIAVTAHGTSNQEAHIRRVCLSMDALATVEKDYRIDPKRRAVSGTSGGGHMAMLTAAMFPDIFVGAISSAAQSYLPGHFPGMDVGDFKRGDRKKNKWMVISGEKDKNYKEILESGKDWEKARMQYKFLDVPGMAHVPPPADRLAECLDWVGMKKE